MRAQLSTSPYTSCSPACWPSWSPFHRLTSEWQWASVMRRPKLDMVTQIRSFKYQTEGKGPFPLAGAGCTVSNSAQGVDGRFCSRVHCCFVHCTAIYGVCVCVVFLPISCLLCHNGCNLCVGISKHSPENSQGNNYASPRCFHGCCYCSSAHLTALKF